MFSVFFPLGCFLRIVLIIIRTRHASVAHQAVAKKAEAFCLQVWGMCQAQPGA